MVLSPCRIPFVGASLALALVSSPAHAESPRINTQTFLPSPHGDDILSAATTAHLAAGSFNAALWLSFGLDPLVFVDAAGNLPDHEVIASQLGMHLTAAFAATDWLSIGLEVPFFPMLDGDDAGFEPLGPVPSAAFGDVRLSAKLGVLRRPRIGDGFGMGLEVSLGLPTGDRDAFVTNGFSVTPMLVVDGRLGPMRLAGNLGARLRGSDDLTIGTETGHELVFRAAVSVDIIEDTLALVGEVHGASHNFENGNNTHVEGLIGGAMNVAEVGSGDLHVTLAGGRGFAEGYGSTSARVVAMVGWTPRAERPVVVVDTDGDGILDTADKCVAVAEDKDGFEDTDGCPDADNDGDGILDDADGCFESEDVDGFQDDDGCPDPDNDGDGILDAADKCPDAAEDKDGHEDNDGCPDPDNDGDGILDAEDDCPADAGNRCGIKVDPCEIRIDQTVQFEYDQAVIKPESFAILDAVVSLMSTRDTVKKVEVQGHTDNEGTPDYNLDLSQRRADAVVAYFVGKGIAAERLAPRGYGQTKPIAANATAAGRAQNRRVQFIILDPVITGCGR